MLAARFSLLSYITHIRNTEPRELIHHNLAILRFQMYDKLRKFLPYRHRRHHHHNLRNNVHHTQNGNA